MRHRVTDNHLGRTVNHRASLLANLTNALFLHKRIRTTLPKAKALRKYAEPLITKSKTDTVHSRRTVFSYLQNKYAVKELFTKIAPEVMDRPGGYTRILKLGPRQGDAAEMALIELVDFNEFYDAKSGGAKQSATKTRRRRKKKKSPSTDESAKA
jgi:large subunit ribosomal protein L17